MPPEAQSVTNSISIVDLVGIAGFVLSVILALSQLWKSRLSIKAETFTLIDPGRYVPDSLFIFVCLSNKTSLPFSLIDYQIRLDRSTTIPIEKTVRTYKSKETKDRLATGPVVLSKAFPVRFDSYASESFLIEVLRRNIDKTLLRPGAPAHSPAELLRKQFLHIRRLCTRQPLPQLVLNTSRGRRVIPIYVESVQNWDWLDKYAVQKAALEGKVSFPE